MFLLPLQFSPLLNSLPLPQSSSNPFQTLNQCWIAALRTTTCPSLMSDQAEAIQTTGRLMPFNSASLTFVRQLDNSSSTFKKTPPLHHRRRLLLLHSTDLFLQVAFPTDMTFLNMSHSMLVRDCMETITMLWLETMTPWLASLWIYHTPSISNSVLFPHLDPLSKQTIICRGRHTLL